VDDLQTHARTALEQVCARGDLDRARELYAERFIDHVNTLEFHGQDGIARSVALYRAIFPDLEIHVLDQSTDGDASPHDGHCAARTRGAP
jgi:SnoaL-like polyketide cyclase